MEPSRSPDFERLLHDLAPEQAFESVRALAARRLGQLCVSDQRVVSALVAASKSDPAAAVREEAARSLRAPAHQEILRQHPALMENPLEISAVSSVTSALGKETVVCPKCREINVGLALRYCQACGHGLQKVPRVGTGQAQLLAAQASETTAQSMPLGIRILSVLLFLGGVLMLITQALATQSLTEAADQLGVSFELLFLSIGFLGLLELGSGVGMWRGKSWGWWLGAFYCAYTVLRNVNTLLSIPGFVQAFGTPPQGVGYYFAKHGVRAVIYALLFLYFFRGNVLAYFGLDQLSRVKSALILIGASIGTVVLSVLLSLF